MLRAMTGLGQREFAEACGLSLAWYNRIETGQRKPTAEQVARIFDVVMERR